jgi:hypothetical protein
MSIKEALEKSVGKIASIKNVSGWAELERISVPNVPTLYSIGGAYYGHIITAELVESVSFSNEGVTITLKGG